MTELLTDAHFWVGVAFVVFIGILVWAGVHKLAWNKLGEAGAKVQAQLDEAAAIRKEAEDLLAQIKVQSAEAEKMAADMLATAQEEARLAAKGAEAEARIAKARDAAMTNVASIAAETADAIVAKLTGKPATAAELAKAGG